MYLDGQLKRMTNIIGLTYIPNKKGNVCSNIFQLSYFFVAKKENCHEVFISCEIVLKLQYGVDE